MSGIEPFLAAMLASTTAAAPAAAGTAAAVGTTAAAGAGAAGLAAGTAGAVGAGAAAAGGLSALEIAALAGSGASLVGTGASLLADKPKIPEVAVATRDDAQREADLRSDLYKKRGRAAALLTPGGGRGDTSSPYLGSAELMGA
jgi:hypothetical protein